MARHGRYRMTALTTVDFLREVPLFANLREADIAALAEDFRPRHYRKGDTIFHQGDQGQCLYVVRRGKVRIYHLSLNGEETTVVILARRHLTGEFSVLDNLPRSASAKAINACTLLEMSQEPFLHYLETIPGLALRVCRLVVGKARWTSIFAETIARLDAAGRLLQLLLLYNDEFGEAEIPGQRYLVDLGLNQADLASMVGTTRGWVNQILGEWRRRELIDFNAGGVIILDLPRVEAERDSRLLGG